MVSWMKWMSAGLALLAIALVAVPVYGAVRWNKLTRHLTTPWEGRWSNYQERNGMRVSITGAVAWLLPEGREPYWRGTITSLAYEY
jgi:hypothetical protein